MITVVVKFSNSHSTDFNELPLVLKVETISIRLKQLLQQTVSSYL